MAKIKTIFKARGVTVELVPESIGQKTPALVQSVLITNPSGPITPTDLARGCAAILKEINLREAKAKRKAKAQKKPKRGGKSKIIAQARMPRKPKALAQTTMFEDAPGDAITAENMAERFPDQAPAPLTANSCVMG